MQSDPSLSSITHVIVDEVHERSIDSDFLLACLKLIERSDLKIILMSATMDHVKLASYFGKPPVLEIPGFTYPVCCIRFFLVFSPSLCVGEMAPPKNKHAHSLTPSLLLLLLLLLPLPLLCCKNL